MIEIDVSGQMPQTAGLWDEVGALADALPTGWVLVGGLMVQLHLIQAGGPEVRVTTDIDVLGQARPEGALNALADTLRRDLKFELGEPDADDYSHRFTRGALVVDILAPDGLRGGPSIRGNTKTVGIPGGSQAIARAEPVLVRTANRSFTLLRPSLLGAVLLKARALPVHRDPDAQLQDLLSLLSVIPDPSAAATELKGRERTWLRRVEERVATPPPGTVSTDTARLARLALQLMVQRH